MEGKWAWDVKKEGGEGAEKGGSETFEALQTTSQRFRKNILEGKYYNT